MKTKTLPRNDYSNISPTAKLTTVLRANSGIAYAKEVSDICDAKAVTRKFFGNDFEMAVKKRSAFAERRFRALDLMIKKYKTDIILELASGLATHGLIFSEDPKTMYFETDLLELITYKKSIVERLLPEKRPNLFFRELNALSLRDYKDTLRNVHSPVTVVNEGLLMYLSHDEISTVAQNVYDVLKEKGGVWINPDVFLRDMYHRFTEQLGTRGTDSVFKTGSSTLDNCFESFEEAEKLFKNIGFSIERHVQTELVPRTTSYTNDEMNSIMSQQEVWILRVA